MRRVLPVCLVSATVGLGIGFYLNSDSPVRKPAAGTAFAGQTQTRTAGAAAAGALPQPSPSTHLTEEELTNIRVYEKANSSVVNINTKSIQVDRFFMLATQAEGSGSGAVLDRRGHVLTKSHVVEEARQIDVTLASGTTVPAELVGSDKEQDIASLRIDAPNEELVPISLGTSDRLRVGQRVYALGNPFGWDGTLTTGIISSLNRILPSRVEDRTMKSLIQTDVAMNPGNSGGPLVDTGGKMVGMCVAIATKTGQNAGIGFAIPIDRIKQMIPDLVEHGRVVRPDIGITHVMETDSGLAVVHVTPNGPADQAGLQGFRRVVRRVRRGPFVHESTSVDRSAADRILAVNGEAMRTGVQFRDKIEQYHPGETVTVTLNRQGQRMDVEVELAAN